MRALELTCIQPKQLKNLLLPPAGAGSSLPGTPEAGTAHNVMCTGVTGLCPHQRFSLALLHQSKARLKRNQGPDFCNFICCLHDVTKMGDNTMIPGKKQRGVPEQFDRDLQCIRHSARPGAEPRCADTPTPSAGPKSWTLSPKLPCKHPRQMEKQK